MGREIARSAFNAEDFEEFRRRLRNETRVLMHWFDDDALDARGGVCGYELEAWLIDAAYVPMACNEAFLERMQGHPVVPELSRFNFEINGDPEPLSGDCFSRLGAQLAETWRHCGEAAGSLGARVAAIGILPTLQDRMLTLENMSPLFRYHALNREVLNMRGGEPLRVAIEGPERLEVAHTDLMMEAAATSLQIHLQVPAAQAVRYYNASQIVSAPLVAVAANSPFLYGRRLWIETRIPLFEQSVAVASFRALDGRVLGRVSFGSGYARRSMMEPFLENLDGYPVLLPITSEEDEAWLSHLRLHNGTIWRWNRPLIGLDAHGAPHLRIEQRVAAAGPSQPDMLGNMAFYLGIVEALARQEPPPESQLDFATCRENFYRAAREGLDAEIVWLDGQRYRCGDLVSRELLPRAREALAGLGVAEADLRRYLDETVAPRVATGRTGADWQLRHVDAHGADFVGLTRAYMERQASGEPVHEWTV